MQPKLLLLWRQKWHAVLLMVVVGHCWWPRSGATVKILTLFPTNKSKTTNSLLEGEECNNQIKAKETFNIIDIVQQPQPKPKQQPQQQQQPQPQPQPQQQEQPKTAKASQIVGSLNDRPSKNNRVALHITRGWQPVGLGRSRTKVKQQGCNLYVC